MFLVPLTATRHCGRPSGARRKSAHPDLNQGPADLQSAALTTELCTHLVVSMSALMTA